jgi:hypothetical protein
LADDAFVGRKVPIYIEENFMKTLIGPAYPRHAKLIGGLAVVVAAGLSSFSVQAEEKRKIQWKSLWGNAKLALLKLNDVPDHFMFHLEREDKILSPDPDWNNTKWVCFEQGDEVAGDSGNLRGYCTHTFKNGDLAYTRMEGAYTGIVKESLAWEGTSQGTLQFYRGTGKYKNIAGSATFHCKGVEAGPDAAKEGASGGCTMEGEISY